MTTAFIALAAVLVDASLGAARRGHPLVVFGRLATATLHEALSTRGILSRLFDTPASLHFGLPAAGRAFARIDRDWHDVVQ